MTVFFPLPLAPKPPQVKNKFKKKALTSKSMLLLLSRKRATGFTLRNLYSEIIKNTAHETRQSSESWNLPAFFPTIRREMRFQLSLE